MAGRLLLKRTDVYYAAKADLDAAQLENDKLAFATDEQKWYRTTAKGLGSTVLAAAPPADAAPAAESVDTDQLVDEAVTEDKLADAAVTEDKLDDAAVTLDKMAADSVDTTQLVNEAVTADKLAPAVGALRDPGRRAVNVLRLASDVVSATTVTIGADVYEIEIVNTDTTDDADNGDFDTEDSPLVVVDAVTSYPGCPFAVGALFRLENEILRVSAVDGDDVTFLRGQSGTAIAAHADTADIFEGDGIDPASTVAVGLVTTLTPTAFSPALVADVNEHGTEESTLTQVSVNELLLVADEVGAVATACAETLGGENNAWAAATMYGGAAPATKQFVAQTRVPNATEVALGNMHFAFDAAPTVLGVEVRVTADGIVVAWGGEIAVDGNVVTLTNDTNPDWTADHTVTVLALLA